MKEVSLLGIWGEFLGPGRTILMSFSKRVWRVSEHELRARKTAVTGKAVLPALVEPVSTKFLRPPKTLCLSPAWLSPPPSVWAFADFCECRQHRVGEANILLPYNHELCFAGAKGH